MSDRGHRLTDDFYSNCLLEAFKAKLRDWKNVTVHYIPRKYQNALGCHFYWTRRGEPDNFYDFRAVQEHRPVIWEQGHLRCNTRQEHDVYRNFGLLKLVRRIAKKYDFKAWECEYYDLEHELVFFPLESDSVLCPALRYGEFKIVGKVRDRNGGLYIKVFDCLASGKIINPYNETILSWHEFDHRVDNTLLSQQWGIPVDSRIDKGDFYDNNSRQVWNILHGRAYLRGTVLESVAEEKRPELSKNFGDYGTNSEAEITAVNKGYEDSFAQFAEGAFKTLVYEDSFFNKLSAISETHFDRTAQQIVDEWNEHYESGTAVPEMFDYFTVAIEAAMQYRVRVRKAYLEQVASEKKAQSEEYFNKHKYGTATVEEKNHIGWELDQKYTQFTENFYEDQLLAGDVVVNALQNPLVNLDKVTDEIHEHDYNEAGILRKALHKRDK